MRSTEERCLVTCAFKIRLLEVNRSELRLKREVRATKWKRGQAGVGRMRKQVQRCNSME